MAFFTMKKIHIFRKLAWVRKMLYAIYIREMPHCSSKWDHFYQEKLSLSCQISSILRLRILVILLQLLKCLPYPIKKFYGLLFDQQARHKIVHIFEAFISRSARNSCTTVDAALAKNTDYLYCLNHPTTHHMIPLTPIGTFRIAFCITSISRVPIKRPN